MSDTPLIICGKIFAFLSVIYVAQLIWPVYSPRHFIMNYPGLHDAFRVAATEPVPLSVSLYMRLDGESREYARAAVLKYSQVSNDIMASMSMEYVVRELGKWSLGKPSFIQNDGDDELRLLAIKALSSSSGQLRKAGLATYSAAISSGLWKSESITKDKVLDVIGQRDDKLKAAALDLSAGKTNIIYIWGN